MMPIFLRFRNSGSWDIMKGFRGTEEISLLFKHLFFEFPLTASHRGTLTSISPINRFKRRNILQRVSGKSNKALQDLLSIASLISKLLVLA